MVQLVTRGLLLYTMRVPSSDEEIEIRVRLPEEDRVLSTLDTLRLRTSEGLVPLAWTKRQSRVSWACSSTAPSRSTSTTSWSEALRCRARS